MNLNEQLNRMKSLMGIKENYEINELSPETMINATNKAYDKGEYTRSGNFISHVANQNFQELKGKPFFGGVIYEVQLVKGMCRLVYKVENETEYFYYNMDNDSWDLSKLQNPFVNRGDCNLLCKIAKTLNPETKYTDFRVLMSEFNLKLNGVHEGEDEINLPENQ